jgi:hypothetical protein
MLFRTLMVAFSRHTDEARMGFGRGALLWIFGVPLLGKGTSAPKAETLRKLKL